MLANREAPIKDRAVTAVHEFTSNGAFKPGGRLPPERERTIRLGLNRTALRKAFDVLERNGAIWRHVGKGTFVATSGGSDGQDGLAALVQKAAPAHVMRALLSLQPALAREAAVNPSDLEFLRVKLTSLLGPSGRGKTALLKVIAGLLEPTAGNVKVNGRTVARPGPDRAFVFQDFALLPWANVLRNVAIGLELHGASQSEREAIAESYVAQIGLSGFERSYPHELSGGMRQRASLASALSTGHC